MKERHVERKDATKEKSIRILGRTLARELTDAELRALTGGACSCSCGCVDDCCEK